MTQSRLPLSRIPSRPPISIDRILGSAVFAAISGMLQFCVCIYFSMINYPGGTLTDRNSVGYSWSSNWISDLGRDSAINGDSNLTSQVYFSWSIIVLGVMLLFFFAASTRAYEELSWRTMATAFFGIMAAIGLIGIGLTPVDRFHNAHITALFLWIVPMILMGIFFTDECLRGESWFGSVIAFLTIGLVLCMLVYAASSISRNSMAMQKIFVLLSAGWFLLISLRVAAAAIYVAQAGNRRIEIVNAQATRYYSKIHSGGLKNSKSS